MTKAIAGFNSRVLCDAATRCSAEAQGSLGKQVGLRDAVGPATRKASRACWPGLGHGPERHRPPTRGADGPCHSAVAAACARGPGTLRTLRGHPSSGLSVSSRPAPLPSLPLARRALCSLLSPPRSWAGPGALPALRASCHSPHPVPTSSPSHPGLQKGPWSCPASVEV